MRGWMKLDPPLPTLSAWNYLHSIDSNAKPYTTSNCMFLAFFAFTMLSLKRFLLAFFPWRIFFCSESESVQVHSRIHDTNRRGADWFFLSRNVNGFSYRAIQYVELRTSSSRQGVTTGSDWYPHQICCANIIIASCRFATRCILSVHKTISAT